MRAFELPPRLRTLAVRRELRLEQEAALATQEKDREIVVLSSLPPSQAAIFNALEAAKGNYVSRDALLAALDEARSHPRAVQQSNTLNVQMSYLRKRVSGFARIECVKRVGWRLVKIKETA